MYMGGYKRGAKRWEKQHLQGPKHWVVPMWSMKSYKDKGLVPMNWSHHGNMVETRKASRDWAQYSTLSKSYVITFLPNSPKKA